MTTHVIYFQVLDMFTVQNIYLIFILFSLITTKQNAQSKDLVLTFSFRNKTNTFI